MFPWPIVRNAWPIYVFVTETMMMGNNVSLKKTQEQEVTKLEIMTTLEI